MNQSTPKGVFAAALTPLKPDGSLDFDGELPYLDFLARRGCSGALLFGTTGEGPSFSPQERLALGKVALQIRQTHPDFMLLMGTGIPSLTETTELTHAAFDLGFPGVVVLPPYFVRKSSDEGLFAWYSEVIRKAIPSDGFILGYHIPQMTGVPLTIPLIERLRSSFPGQFVGVKNSWTEVDFARTLGDYFGSSLVVMAGFDHFFDLTLSKGGAGCITASATLVSPLLRQLYDAHQRGENVALVQQELGRIREVMDAYPPAPALLKGMLAKWHSFPLWSVRPPLMPLPEAVIAAAAEAIGGPIL